MDVHLLSLSLSSASTINATTHPFYDKHDALIKSIWSVDRSSKNVDEKLAKVKEAIGSSSPSSLFDIYNEKTGESRAKVSPLIIACFEGDYDTIKFLIDVSELKSLHAEGGLNEGKNVDSVLVHPAQCRCEPERN